MRALFIVVVVRTMGTIGTITTSGSTGFSRITRRLSARIFIARHATAAVHRRAFHMGAQTLSALGFAALRRGALLSASLRAILS